ncbi:MAG: host attachment protein [Azospirillaceae bacterium]
MKLPPKETWIVVADGQRARFYHNDGRSKTLARVMPADMVDPNPKTRDQGSDRPGREHSRFGPGRAALGDTDWHEYEKHVFAHEVAGRINAARRDGAFERLVLVAPPKTLGDLRKMLDSHTAELVDGELDKDVTHESDAALTERLAALL